MITKLSVSNFRSLGTVEFAPGALNFIVGVNGSGKSNLLRALTFMREAVRIGLPGAVTSQGGIESVRRHSGGHPRNVNIDITAKLDSGTANYGFEITGDKNEEYRVKREWGSVVAGEERTRFRVEHGRWDGPKNMRPRLDEQSLAITAIGGDARIKPLWDFLANTMVYAIYPDVLREPQKFSSETPMMPRGENWLSILHQQFEMDWKADLVAALGKLTGDIDDVRVTKTSSFLMAEFRHERPKKKAKKWFGTDLESDGTLRVAGLLTALLQHPAPPAIGIEEPELTVHPGALPLLYDYLLEASERSQILVTTHSPLLLDYLDLKDARVFVTQRQESGTTVTPLSESHKNAVKKQLLTLGELMISGELQLELPIDGAHGS